MYSVCTVFEVRLFYCGYKFLTDINFHKVSAKKKKKKKNMSKVVRFVPSSQ